jgi:hyperosmotically inducible protein
VALSFAAVTATAATTTADNARLSEQVRHELVIRPTLRSSAERVVQRIEGISEVENKIEVLPVSTFDDRIRIAVYRAVYGGSGLQRYQLPVHGPIRIIVRNGDVTLKGVVASDMDRNLAGMYANGVSGVFSVINDLRVVRS